MIDRLADALRAVHSVALIPHVGPDGDAIGSALALMFALRRMGKHADVVSHDAVPFQYTFLPGIDGIINAPEAGVYDAAVAMDVSDTQRIGGAAYVFKHARLKMCIDHHTTSNPDFCDIMVLDKDAASTGNLVCRVIKALDVPIDRDIAICLYVAISTDTGHFNYNNTTGGAMRDAAELVDAGIDVGYITRTLYRTRSEARTRLIGRALGTLELYAGGRVASMRLSRRDFEETGAQDADNEGLINYAIEIKGVCGAVLGRETSSGIKFSLRGLGHVDVSIVAQRFGGGGHKAAAGCTLDMPLDKAVELVAQALIEESERAD